MVRKLVWSQLTLFQSNAKSGYGWGDRKQRRTVDVKNYRDRQTYYGAVDLLTQELLIQTAHRPRRGPLGLRTEQAAKTADGMQTVNLAQVSSNSNT